MKYSPFRLLVAVIVYQVAVNTELANAEPLVLLGKQFTDVVLTLSPTDRYIPSLHEPFCLCVTNTEHRARSAGTPAPRTPV